MTIVATILDRAGESLGGFLPRLGGALALLVLGVLLSRLVARLLRRALERAGADDLAERWRVHDALERIALPRSISRVTGTAFRVGLTLVVVFAALSLLGLQFLSQSLNEAVLLLPRILVAAVLLLAGVVISGYVRERVDRLAYQMDFPVPLGQLAQVAVVAIFGITAASQLGLATAFLVLIAALIAAATAITFSLAFGLGGREMARALSAGRYVRGSFDIGQTVAVGDVRGEITRIESAATILRTPDGRTVHVPNHMLLESVVTIDRSPDKAT